LTRKQHSLGSLEQEVIFIYFLNFFNLFINLKKKIGLNVILIPLFLKLLMFDTPFSKKKHFGPPSYKVKESFGLILSR